MGVDVVCAYVCDCVCVRVSCYASRRCASLQMTSIQSAKVIAIVPFLRNFSSTHTPRTSEPPPTMFTNAYALSLTLPCAFASVCMCVRVRVVYVRGCVRRL